MDLLAITQTLKPQPSMEEIFCLDNFFSENEMAEFDSAVALNEPGFNYHASTGPFVNNLIANYVSLDHDLELISKLTKKISSVMPDTFNILNIVRVKLFLPWDIHSDYYIAECHPGYVPYYNFLLPLDNVESRTIVFDQATDYNPMFSAYKKNNPPADNPIDETFWKENLSMCWAHDREYVSLRKCMPWQRRGQLTGFPSKYFHSSDNFHTKFSTPKSFIQIRTEYKPSESC